MNIMPAGRAFCCFTSNTSSHQEEASSRKVGKEEKSWVDGGVGGDVCLGGRTQKGGHK